MSNRIEQVNKLIREELSSVILREIEFPAGTLATLTRIETTIDLLEARVYVSVIPDSKADFILSILKRKIYGLQQEINRRLKMRPVPKISFVKEKQTTEAGTIEGILEKIKK